jgi:hypothetical protein
MIFCTQCRYAHLRAVSSAASAPTSIAQTLPPAPQLPPPRTIALPTLPTPQAPQTPLILTFTTLRARDRAFNIRLFRRPASLSSINRAFLLF